MSARWEYRDGKYTLVEESGPPCKVCGAPSSYTDLETNLPSLYTGPTPVRGYYCQKHIPEWSFQKQMEKAQEKRTNWHAELVKFLALLTKEPGVQPYLQEQAEQLLKDDPGNGVQFFGW